MKKNLNSLITTGCCLACLLGVTLTVAAAAEQPVLYSDSGKYPYNPAIDYNGEYLKTRLYYRNPRSYVWMRMSVSDNYRDVVTCRSALSALETGGAWLGHLLGDGSCGPLEEPAHFVLGNRINYDILLDQDVSSR